MQCCAASHSPPLPSSTLQSVPHQSITTQRNTTPHYTTLRSAHITSDFSMRIAKLSMRDRAWRFFESIPCKPPRAMDNPLELNTPVVMWKREGECVCVCVLNIGEKEGVCVCVIVFKIVLGKET